MHFADSLIHATRQIGNSLCVGLDPFANQIPAIFGPNSDVQTLEAFFMTVLDRLAGKVAVVKPQIGLFEPFGHAGYALVQRLSARARDLGLLVILDAKRGDIGTTADGYARACVGPDSYFQADCVTLNPYMGLDTLAPFVDRAKAHGTGLAVLVRTSNPGARDVQDLVVDGAPLWQAVARMLLPIQDALVGSTGYSSLMVVAGATYPDEARQLRQILPRSLFLVPGYGAQGASARDAQAGFILNSPDGVVRNQLEGGVVSSSRAILYPKGAQEAANIAAWADIFDAQLAASITELTQVAA